MKKEISKLHVITQDRSDKTHLDQIVNVCKGGAQWVQLRVKNVDNLIWTEIAKDAKKICHQFGTKLIVNDSPGLVKEVGADGVHLGKQDMNPLEARNMLGEDVIIGGTANTKEDISRLVSEGVDYIGLGPFRHTTTKGNLSPILGVHGVKEILTWAKEEGLSVPIVLIGGLRLEDTLPILKMGVHGVAVSSAIHDSVNADVTTAAYLNAIEVFENE